MKEIKETIQLLGQQILASEEYAALKKAEEANNADANLTALINEFELCRSEIAPVNEENEAEMVKKHEHLESLYEQIMANENMMAYNNAAVNFENLIKSVYDGINTAVFGQQECTHDCSTCGGCH